MRTPEAVRAAEAEAMRLGAGFDWEYGSKRITGIVKLGQYQRKIFISKTGSDFRIINNVREDVRHKVRELQCLQKQ